MTFRTRPICEWARNNRGLVLLAHDGARVVVLDHDADADWPHRDVYTVRDLVTSQESTRIGYAWIEGEVVESLVGMGA